MKKKKCPYCSKVIDGFTDRQVEHLLKQHILSKHEEKVKFNGDKNE